MKFRRLLFVSPRCALYTSFAVCLFAGAALPCHARAGLLTYATQARYPAASIGNSAYSFADAVNASHSHVLDFENDDANGSDALCLSAHSDAGSVTLSGPKVPSFTLGAYAGAQHTAISVNGAAATGSSSSGKASKTMFVRSADSVPVTGLTAAVATPGGFYTNAIPEPSTWAAVLGGAGLLGLTLRRRAARV